MPLTQGVSPAPTPRCRTPSHYTQALDARPPPPASSLTLDELVALNGGRLPVGVNPQLAKGPFTISWTRSGERRLWLTSGEVLDFTQTATTTVTISWRRACRTRAPSPSPAPCPTAPR